MPDITGWSRTDVVSLCKLLNLKYNIEGYGIVTSFSIPADAVINLDDTLSVNLNV